MDQNVKERSAHDLKKETEAAKTLLANMADVLGDDAELKVDTVEGETGFFEALQQAVDRIGEVEAHAEGLAEYQRKIASRKARLERQADLLRTAIAAAMDAVGVKSREMDRATLTVKAKPREPVITDEALIPSEYWKPQDPKLDRAALCRAAKDGQEIPGVTLDNGGNSLTIRRS